MKTVLAILPGMLLLSLVSGCAATKVSESNLYWGKYSDTLYQVKKSPGEDSHAAHEKELFSIVEKSKSLNLRVPPGVYAELGLYALERGEQAEAEKYFALEHSAYPESGALIEQVLDF